MKALRQTVISLPHHFRHFSSKISFGFVSDGSPLPTCGDDDWVAFSLALVLNGI